ncbi:hypothetical protein ISN44_As13g010900 [Arabidopsis suecica]|nr:hypothetical protein ISN44_As13g010900 [Arabidopsis suecica]KAG7537167.1 hypothetical protein ISN44_As13g010900 [Arabidopsis suecica]
MAVPLLLLPLNNLRPSLLRLSRLSLSLPQPKQEARGIIPGKSNETIVSVFVLLQIVLFAVTMGVNDCSGNSHGHCAAKHLGRFSFQPLFENPMFGPSAST